MCSTELEGINTVRLSAGALEAQFAPALGMAGPSLRHEGDELLDRQAGLLAFARTGAVMGVPLLYAWADRLAGHDHTLDGREVSLPPGPPLVDCEEHGLPIHGLLHASPHWRVPTDTTPVPIAFGFHPYLRLPGVPRAAWHVRLPAHRHLLLDDRGIPTGMGERQPATRLTLGDRGFDDGYDGLGPRSVVSVGGGGRAITVELEAGYPAAQVFSPRGKGFVCLSR